MKLGLTLKWENCKEISQSLLSTLEFNKYNIPQFNKKKEVSKIQSIKPEIILNVLKVTFIPGILSK